MLRRLTLFLASFALSTLLPALSPPPAVCQIRASAQQLAQPWALVRWKPVPENPVFTGTGRDTWDRKIRERGYILPDHKGNYDLWYTGYAGDRPATMSLRDATSPDGIHWPRDPANPDFAQPRAE